ncbi:hypothetical protein KEH51_01390 [[Brevibacterium] frigoritolerans]|uniref:Lipoprotein n=1 Tax=Peribacillus frigoritolerans TaxID=450367 RepID=A0A941FGL0_9BACI|nr:hypothetical protein [Peribacillus frigoritolerans]
MRKLLWIFGLLVIIMALGGCSSSSKTSGSSKVKAKAVGYQMVQKNGVLSDRKGISEKDDVKKLKTLRQM